MILFFTANTCSLAPHLALAHAGAEYQLRRVDFGKSEQRSAELLRINPKRERELLLGPWVMGERFSICDLYQFTFAQWLESDGVDPARFPKVAAHRQRLREDPLVQRVLAAEEQS